jgi:hypothetical protein
MKTLQISDSLKLPLEALTETFAVLGKRGSGKTNFGVVLVEELVGAGLPVVVIDPVGVWFGLRSSADGKSPGLPVTILGGEHGDVPLEEGAGSVIADFVIEARQSCVLDLSLLRKGQQIRFMTDFAERLYHAKGTRRDPLHIVVDEADAFAPQNPRPESARLLGAMEDLVRRGRSRGLGLTLITQRPASLNKNVLTQAEVLVVFQLVGPLDRKAIDEWVKMNGSEEERAQLLASIASLPVGTAWVWSPSWLKTFQKIGVRRRHTFDSSATPKAGAKLIEPRVLAPVDLEALRGRIAETIERAKADDPRELRKTIVDLQRQLRAKAPAAAAPAKERIVEVPVVRPAEVKRLEAAAHAIGKVCTKAIIEAVAILKALESIAGPAPAAAQRPATALPSLTPPAAATPPRAPRFSVPPPKSRGVEGAPALRKGARKLLDTLARHHPMRVSRAQLATLAGFTVSGGTFQTYLSDLRRGDFVVERDGLFECTAGGLAEAGVEPGSPMTQAEVVEQWRQALRAGARAMLDIVLRVRHLSRDELAAAVEMTASGGTFQTYLSDLRRNGLVSVSGGTITVGEALETAS